MYHHFSIRREPAARGGDIAGGGSFFSVGGRSALLQAVSRSLLHAGHVGADRSEAETVGIRFGKCYAVKVTFAFIVSTITRWKRSLKDHNKTIKEPAAKYGQTVAIQNAGFVGG